MNEYINVGKMQESLCTLLKDTRESFRDKENSAFLDDSYNDDYIEELAWCMADGFNSDMKSYLHLKNHKIDGNFGNIEYDYNLFINGEVEFNIPLLNDMIKRLDDNDQSEKTQKDRDFLNDWFFETFGTFGIRYNFGEEIADRLYETEKDK